VYASFAGSESYYAASAETSFYASDVQSTPIATTSTTESTVDSYFVPAVIGIILAIAIGFAITILVLKKR